MRLTLFVTLIYLSCFVHSYSSPSNLSLANTTFYGIELGDFSGWSVSSAGDFNNDGLSDILISAHNGDSNGLSSTGKTFLIFGTNQSLGSQLNLSSINGTNGIIFNGIDASDKSSFSVLIRTADPYGNSNAGETCLIFGTNQSLGSQFNLSSINGTNGIIFNGIDASDLSGWSVSSAGDFNKDGFSDILIGASNADPNGNSNAGETYLIFGTNSSLGSQFNLSSINSTYGIIFNGIDAGDLSGQSVSSAGDFNNDGFDDILISGWNAAPNGNSAAGETYLIFGINLPFFQPFNLSSINGGNGIIFNGIASSDGSGYSVSSAGDFNNDGFDDILIGVVVCLKKYFRIENDKLQTRNQF